MSEALILHAKGGEVRYRRTSFAAMAATVFAEHDKLGIDLADGPLAPTPFGYGLTFARKSRRFGW